MFLPAAVLTFCRECCRASRSRGPFAYTFLAYQRLAFRQQVLLSGVAIAAPKGSQGLLGNSELLMQKLAR